VLAEWMRHGEMRAGYLDATELGGIVVDALALALDHPTVDVQHLVLRPVGPLLSDAGGVLATAAEQREG
jgi:hypothetical protein